ncbi:hypothetical protein KEM54_006640 [Ascosphaera aggregata]|nr:hypothetical protein KEM54_006640 [Ascosphaera aggregata]
MAMTGSIGKEKMTMITLDSPSTMNTASTNLTHLLDRLSAKVADADIRPLLRSEYHRARIAVNIQYAQMLLEDLEKACAMNAPRGAGQYIKSATTTVAATATATATATTATTTTPSAGISYATALQPDLASQRQKLTELVKWFEEIEEQATVEAEILESRSYDADHNENEEDGEEIIVPMPEGSDGDVRPVAETENSSVEKVTDEPVKTREEGTQAGLRNRRTVAAATATATTTATETGTSTSTSTATGTGTGTGTGASRSKAAAPPSLRSMQEELLRNRTVLEPSSSNIQDVEAHLSRDRAEQETLTTSLLQLASQLKESTHTFASSLEGEKSILARAVEGLDRNISGMESAAGQMGMVRRMAEGKGWWDRMLLYGMIFGLWVVVILLVFVAPKLRI